jgi:exonuclease I
MTTSPDAYHFDCFDIGFRMGVVLFTTPDNKFYPLRSAMTTLEHTAFEDAATLIFTAIFRYLTEENMGFGGRVCDNIDFMDEVVERTLIYLNENSEKAREWLETGSDVSLLDVVKWAMNPDSRPVDFEGFDDVSLADRLEQLANVLDQTEMQEKDLLFEAAERLKGRK